jgi:hypothetical protein
MKKPALVFIKKEIKRLTVSQIADKIALVLEKRHKAF